MAFDPRNLIRPLAPGLPGAVNPLAFIGAGMASGDMGSQLARMGQLQITGQEAERNRKQQEAMSAVAPGVAQQLYPGNTAMQQLMASNPQLLAQAVQAQMKTPSPTSAEKLYTAMGGQAGTGKTFSDWYASDFKGPGTTVNVGGVGDLGAVPSAMARVEDPTSPTGTRLVQEPGAPAEAKAAQARRKAVAPLDALKDSLSRYRAALETHGPEIAMGPGKTALDTAYTDLLMKQKEAYNLGALTGPDLELMERLIINPTSMTAQMYEKTGKTQALIDQLDQMDTTLSDAVARAKGEEPGPSPDEGAGGYQFLGYEDE